MKIFNNGRIQMTGLKSETMGTEAIQHLLDILLNLKEEIRIKICLNDTSIPKLIETNIVLINSDFDIGFKIDRENLHRSIIEKGYYSSFEPCIYPGVNIKYYHHPLVKNYGICSCDNPCNGKGKENTCKKITIAVFNSGKIIITGGQTLEHIHLAKDFITKFINGKRKLFEIK